MKDWGDDGVSAGWGYRSPNPPHRAQEEEEEEDRNTKEAQDAVTEYTGPRDWGAGLIPCS